MGADVKDLLVRMSLNTTDFKKNIQDAKGEIKTLKAEFQAAASGGDVEKVGATLLENLKQQKEAAEGLIKEYENGIAKIQTGLDKEPAGSKHAGELQKAIQTMETGLANAQKSANELQTAINNFKIDTFVEQMEQCASAFTSLKLGLGGTLDKAGEAADTADKAFVSREAAFTSATKNVEDAHQNAQDLAALNRGLREMTVTIPRTYKQLAGLMGVAATLDVPYENLLQFTEVMAKLNVATNVAGEGGAQAMAQFLNISEKGFGNLDRVGAALTELGNNSATTEQNILEMAHRAATGLSTVGMDTADILALSAAINSVGIEAQAGGSSISKLGITMDKASKVGADSIDMLLKAWSKNTPFETIYELYAHLDALGNAKGWRSMAEELGMTMADTKALMNSALAAERFSGAMGMTVDQFAKGWNEDAANTMLTFFRSLGDMDGTDAGENMLWVMDQLGIKEIRQSNMVRALANNWELYANMLTLGRDAYKENVALEEEAQRAFGTNESRRVMNANKQENAMEAMGETVTTIRRPFEEFFGYVNEQFTQLPTWVQTAAGGATEAFGTLGSVLDTAGTLSFNVLNIAKGVRELKQTGMALKTAGKYAVGAGVAGIAAIGMVELVHYLQNVSDKTAAISQDLSGLKITIDPTSKDETMRAIAEVQQAAEQLRAGDSGHAEEYANTSRVVQMGYGTAGMYGTALAWEQKQNEAALEKLYTDYGAKIREQEQILLGESSAAQKEAAQASIQRLTQEMAQAADSQKAAYTQVLSSVINGAVEQLGQTDELTAFSQKYSLLDAVYKGWANYQQNGDTAFTASGAKAALQRQLQEAGASLFDKRGMMDFSGAASQIYASLAEDVKKLGQNGQLMSILSSALSSGALNEADVKQLSGSALALFQAMDIKQIGNQGAKDWRQIGQLSVMGLANGVTDANGQAIGATTKTAQDMLSAVKAALDIHSPSGEMRKLGLQVDAGLADGILAGVPDAVSAMKTLGAAIAAEAEKQSALIRAAMTVIAPAPSYAAGTAASVGAAIGASTTTNNNTSITVNANGSAQTTRSARELARAIAAEQRRANASLGQLG